MMKQPYMELDLTDPENQRLQDLLDAYPEITYWNEGDGEAEAERIMELARVAEVPTRYANSALFVRVDDTTTLIIDEFTGEFIHELKQTDTTKKPRFETKKNHEFMYHASRTLKKPGRDLLHILVEAVSDRNRVTLPVKQHVINSGMGIETYRKGRKQLIAAGLLRTIPNNGGVLIHPGYVWRGWYDLQQSAMKDWIFIKQDPDRLLSFDSYDSSS